MHRSRAHSSRIASAILLLIAWQSGCDSRGIASVESLEDGQPRTVPLTFYSLDGRRDGDRVNAALEFRDPGGRDRLSIQLVIDLGPPIHLAGGTFHMQRSDKTQTGRVDSTSLDFQAGQSGGMGLGGKFILLDHAGKVSYRVHLPRTVIGPTYR